MNAALPSEPGIRISLAELIEMRHRVREVQLFSTPSQRSPLIGLHHSKFRGRGVDFDQVQQAEPHPFRRVPLRQGLHCTLD